MACGRSMEAGSESFGNAIESKDSATGEGDEARPDFPFTTYWTMVFLGGPPSGSRLGLQGHVLSHLVLAVPVVGAPK